MNLSNIAQNLIDKHAARIRHLKGLTGATAREHYKQGVADLLNAIQHAAMEDDIIQRVGNKLANNMDAEILTAPLAVSPNHVATEANPLGVPEAP